MARAFRTFDRQWPKYKTLTLSTAGSSTISLQRGFYNVKVIAGGGGCCMYVSGTPTKGASYASGHWYWGGGGGGASGEYIVRIPNIADASVIVGKGGSKNSSGGTAGNGGASRFVCGNVNITMAYGCGGSWSSLSSSMSGGAGGKVTAQTGVYQIINSGAGSKGTAKQKTKLPGQECGYVNASGYPVITSGYSGYGGDGYYAYWIPSKDIEYTAEAGYVGKVVITYLGLRLN